MTVRLTPLEPWIAATIGADGPGLDRAQLQRHQLARLRSTVQLARERSPFYRDRLRDLPIGPDTLQDVAGTRSPRPPTSPRTGRGWSASARTT